MDLKTFTLNPACPKCGHTSILREYKAERINATTYLGSRLPDTKEHLVLTCTTCTYEWEMETADHENL